MLEYSFFQLSDTAKERKVPSSRFSRVANFGGEWNLNAGLICRIFETGLEESVYKYLHVVWLFTSLTLHCRFVCGTRSRSTFGGDKARTGAQEKVR